MFSRRQVLIGSTLLATSAALPGHLQAACAAVMARWPREGELVDGNESDLVIAKARAMMVKVGHAALVSIDDGALPRVRSVGTREPEDDLTVWILTHASSRKIEQIRARPEVALHYVDIEEVAQVTLMGVATVHADEVTVREKNFYSDEQVSEYWPGFPERYAMISFRPIWLEISAPGSGIKGDPARWRPAGLKL